MPVIDLADVVADVRERPAVNGIRLVGIDGPAGSGKSTLARRLAPMLAAPIVTTDDFLSWRDLTTWWGRFETEALAPLFARHDARYQVRDWRGDPEGDGLDGWKTTTWSGVVIVEGVTSTRRDVSDRLAYRIWVETSENLRRERNLARADYWRDHWDDWVALETSFFRDDRAKERADLVVDGAPAVHNDPETQLVSR
jgi:AAA domain-containing protein